MLLKFNNPRKSDCFCLPVCWPRGRRALDVEGLHSSVLLKSNGKTVKFSTLMIPFLVFAEKSHMWAPSRHLCAQGSSFQWARQCWEVCWSADALSEVEFLSLGNWPGWDSECVARGVLTLTNLCKAGNSITAAAILYMQQSGCLGFVWTGQWIFFFSCL